MPFCRVVSADISGLCAVSQLKNIFLKTKHVHEIVENTEFRNAVLHSKAIKALCFVKTRFGVMHFRLFFPHNFVFRWFSIQLNSPGFECSGGHSQHIVFPRGSTRDLHRQAGADACTGVTCVLRIMRARRFPHLHVVRRPVSLINRLYFSWWINYESRRQHDTMPSL